MQDMSWKMEPITLHQSWTQFQNPNFKNLNSPSLEFMLERAKWDEAYFPLNCFLSLAKR